MSGKKHDQFFWRELFWIDPLDLGAVLQQEKRNPVLFLSGKALPEERGGKYSFLPFDPQKTLLQRAGSDFRTLLENNLGAKRTLPATVPEIFHAFCGGLCGFFSYDFAHELETFRTNRSANPHIPKALFQVFERFVAYDHLENKSFLAGWFPDEKTAQQFFDFFEAVVLVPEAFPSPEEFREQLQFTPEISESEYLEAIKLIQKELRQGNSYQVNFSQKWTARSNYAPLSLFRRLVAKNPAPMMFYGEWDDFAILSCSPERLFSLQDGRLFTQPIAGTRKRGHDEREDFELESELQKNPKELAEHTMLVDLLRNDFGRIARFGSVRVEEFARVEKYASVMHLVSDIVAELDDRKTVFDAFSAVFPGGTVTGAPKIETMDILGRLERSARGVYCGSAGYFSWNGNADFNILIRTLQKTGEKLELRAGGGIVIDSEADAEYRESLQKALGLIAPLGMVRF